MCVTKIDKNHIKMIVQFYSQNYQISSKNEGNLHFLNK